MVDHGSDPTYDIGSTMFDKVFVIGIGISFGVGFLIGTILLFAQ